MSRDGSHYDPPLTRKAHLGRPPPSTAHPHRTWVGVKHVTSGYEINGVGPFGFEVVEKFAHNKAYLMLIGEER